MPVLGPCFRPWQCALGTAGVTALRPLRGGLRPAWTPAAAQRLIEAAGSEKESEHWGNRGWTGTPLPSVVSGVSNHRHQRKGNGVRSSRLWVKLLGCENTLIEDADWQEEGCGDGSGPVLRLIVHVRPHKRLVHRCGICGKKRPRYDRGQGRRRWRALDLGTVRAYLEADAPRVSCPEHGVITAPAEDPYGDLMKLKVLRDAVP